MSNSYRNNWISLNYDRINLTVPKGYKKVIADFCADHGISVNFFINNLISSYMDNAVRPLDFVNKVEKSRMFSDDLD